MAKIPHFLLLLSFAFALFACGNNSGDATTAAPPEAASPEISETVTQTAEPTSGSPVPSSEAPTDEAEAETFTAVYRSDGFYPGIASEWVAVTNNSESDAITKIEYWNTDDETKISLRIIQQTYHDEGMPGYDGTLAFPGQDPIGFGIVEDMFNLTHEGDRFQQFIYEYE